MVLVVVVDYPSFARTLVVMVVEWGVDCCCCCCFGKKRTEEDGCCVSVMVHPPTKAHPSGGFTSW